MNKIKVLSLLVYFFSGVMFASQSYIEKVGATTLTVGVWEAKVSGSIKNNQKNADFEDTLGYGEANNITYFALDLDNNSYIMPDIKITASILNQSTTPIVSNIVIDDKTFDGALSTQMKYATINTLLYGYTKKEDLRLNIGLNIKYINFTEEVEELTSGGYQTKTEIDGFILLPHLGVDYKIDFLNTVLSAEASGLSIGDIQVVDYSYGVRYYFMQDMFVALENKVESFKAKKDNDKFEYILSGSMISFNLRF